MTSSTPRPHLAARTEAEVTSQPGLWRRAAGMAAGARDALPADGTRVLGVGCGTSYYILQSYARRRQQLGHGTTRAAIATELDDPDPYDVALLLSRSGTTSDLVRVAHELSERMTTVAITGTPGSPIVGATHRHVLLDWADEESVVQTRFATTALALLRATLGDDLAAAAGQAESALAAPLVPDVDHHRHVVFLGTGWTLGLAEEAALKLRESAGLWTEAYAVQEYRHGPIACAGPHSLVWSFATPPPDVADAVAATGARLHVAAGDPQADLVRVHRAAVAYARARGIDADAPPHLSRSVVVA